MPRPAGAGANRGAPATSNDDNDDDWSEDSEDADLQLPSHVFYENEALIRALNDPRRGSGDSAVAQRLFAALVGATLITLVPETMDLELGPDGTVEQDMEITFVLVQHPDVEGDIVPMFTDEGAVAAFTAATSRYVALAVRDLFPLLTSAGTPAPCVVVNPGGDEALLLTPRMVQDVVDAVRGHSLDIVQDDSPVVVGLPKEPIPGSEADEIVAVLKHHPGIIRCLQLQWYMAHRHDEPSLVLALELEPHLQGKERKTTLAAVWVEMSPVLKKLDRTVEMVDLDAQRDTFGDLLDRAPALYERDA